MAIPRSTGALGMYGSKVAVVVPISVGSNGVLKPESISSNKTLKSRFVARIGIEIAQKKNIFKTVSVDPVNYRCGRLIPLCSVRRSVTGFKVCANNYESCGIARNLL